MSKGKDRREYKKVGNTVVEKADRYSLYFAATILPIFSIRQHLITSVENQTGIFVQTLLTP